MPRGWREGDAVRVVSQAARVRVDLPLRDLPVPDAVPRAGPKWSRMRYATSWPCRRFPTISAQRKWWFAHPHP